MTLTSSTATATSGVERSPADASIARPFPSDDARQHAGAGHALARRAVLALPSGCRALDRWPHATLGRLDQLGRLLLVFGDPLRHAVTHPLARAERRHAGLVQLAAPQHGRRLAGAVPCRRACRRWCAPCPSRAR